MDRVHISGPWGMYISLRWTTEMDYRNGLLNGLPIRTTKMDYPKLPTFKKKKISKAWLFIDRFPQVLSAISAILMVTPTERKNRCTCAMDSGILPAIRFSKWRTTNQNNTVVQKADAPLYSLSKLQNSTFRIRHLPSKLWTIL